MFTKQNCFNPSPDSYRFQDDWRLSAGNNELNFQGKGRDVYIQLNNQNNSSSHQYWIVINGWDNRQSRVTRGDGSVVCQPNVAALDLNRQYNYRVVLDASTATISVQIDGKDSFSCKDNNGWNAANAQWFSISRCGCADFQFCGLQSRPLEQCFNPDPNSYKFQDDWRLSAGNNELNFRGKGRDVYIQLNNQNNSSSHQYWIVINGWDNRQSRVTRGDGSTVCQPNVAALDLNRQYNYRVILNAQTSTITVQIDGNESFSCKDNNGWNAADARWFSVSRCGCADFQFCGVKQCFNPTNSYRFQDDWRLSAGNNELNFQGKGRDVYIQLNNQNNSSSHQYWIVINGWDNRQSRVTRGDGSTICQPNVAALDLNRQYNYKVILDASTATISVLIDGNESFSCRDPNGWNANNAQWFSFAKCDCADFQVCGAKANPVNDVCFNPDPNSYKFQDNWRLPQGNSAIAFKGKGRDVYVQLNNQNNSSSHQYWIVINGWDNKQSRVTRGDGSVVCQPNVSALDLNKLYNYKVVLNAQASTISVQIDGKESFSCKDNNGWNASNAQWFSFSRYGGADFQVCNAATRLQ